MLHSGGDCWYYGSEGWEYLNDMSNGMANQLANSASTKHERLVLKLMRLPPLKVKDNLTDDDLKRIAGKNGGNIRKRGASRITSISASYFQALGQFNQSEVTTIISRCRFMYPEFVYGDKPYNGTDPTWASQSLRNACQDIQLAALVKRSAVLKFAVEGGKLQVPALTRVDFRWSGQPSVVIDLSFPMWTKKDIPELRALVNSSFYGELARARLVMLEG
jgi:hypothetical protein